MAPIHVAGEMAVWSEEKWADFEGDLQRQFRAERRRLDRLARARRQAANRLLWQTASWGMFVAAVLLALLY
jgi:hypothetical protein